MFTMSLHSGLHPQLVRSSGLTQTAMLFVTPVARETNHDKDEKRHLIIHLILTTFQYIKNQ